MVRVAFQLLKVQRRMVVETLVSRFVKELIERIVVELAAFAALILFQNLCLW